MTLKIELNDEGEIWHVYQIFHNPGESAIDPHEPESGLEIDESYADLHNIFLHNLDLMKRIYLFRNGKFEKRTRREVELDIADWVDHQPFDLPEDHSRTDKGLQKKNVKTINDLTPEELNQIAEPIPVLDDFPDISKAFVKQDLYKKNHNIEF